MSKEIQPSKQGKTYVSTIYRKSSDGSVHSAISLTVNGVTHNLPFDAAESLCIDLLWAIRCKCCSSLDTTNPYLHKFRQLLTACGLQPEASSLPIDSLVEAITNRFSN